MWKWGNMHRKWKTKQNTEQQEVLFWQKIPLEVIQEAQTNPDPSTFLTFLLFNLTYWFIVSPSLGNYYPAVDPVSPLKALIELCSLTDTYLKAEDSSQDSLCHFESTISFSELITLPIKAVTPSSQALYLNVYLCACRQGDGSMFDLDMSDVISFGSFSSPFHL